MNWDRTAIPGQARSRLSSAMRRWVEPFAGAVLRAGPSIHGCGTSGFGGGQRAAMLRIAVVTASVRFDTPSLR
jgi:hypothetical protein